VVWNTAGAKTASRRSRPKAPRSIQNAADVATAISESMIRTAASGPVALAIAAAGT